MSVEIRECEQKEEEPLRFEGPLLMSVYESLQADDGDLQPVQMVN